MSNLYYALEVKDMLRRGKITTCATFHCFHLEISRDRFVQKEKYCLPGTSYYEISAIEFTALSRTMCIKRFNAKIKQFFGADFRDVDCVVIKF